jgi:hypothetical protein
MKFTMTKIAAGLVLVAASMSAQATQVTSLTIEEIGVASGGLGSSAASSVGGTFFFQNISGAQPDGASVGFNFTSPVGGNIIGGAQGNNTFATPFAYGGALPLFGFYPNSCGANNPTVSCAGSGATASNGISADYSGAGLTINLANWGGYYNVFQTQFPLGPDSGTLTISASALDANNHFYYTADWKHTITQAEGGVSFGGSVADWHIEGVGVAAVPEASTYGMMLAGLGLVGFAVRRRKLIA